VQRWGYPSGVESIEVVCAKQATCIAEGKKQMMKALYVSLLVGLVGTPATAGLCDYRPSQWIGDEGSAAIVGGGAAVAGSGVAAKTAGFYVLTHATTSATMIGSTAAGASAAGTVGIMAGTGGVAGTVAAIVMAPVTIVVAGVTAAGVGAYEGACFFQDERITDYDQVLEVMANMAANSDPASFALMDVDGMKAIRLTVDGQETQTYFVEDLYIVNGMLMNRDWFKNTKIGRVSFVVPD
jgi:hypothetical protein